MNDPTSSEYQYGHPGTTVYDRDFKSWEFSRTFNGGDFLTLARDSTISNNTNCPKCIHGAHSQDCASNGLLSTHPELVSGLGELDAEEQPSRIITSSLSDFTDSGSLAFGNAVCVADGRVTSQTMPVMVCLSSSSNLTITVCKFDPGRLDFLSETANVSLDLNHQLFSSWISPGGPVRQLSAAEPVAGQNTYFAIRRTCSTTIFRSLYRQSFVPTSLHHNPSTELPTLDPLVNIPSSLSGGHAHAAVVFNPWYQQQLAIIDTAGNWNIWDIQHRQQRNAGWFADRGPSGSLRLLHPESSILAYTDRYDGWGAISWVGSIHQLFICDRRNVALCRIDLRPPTQEYVNIMLENSSEWILDVMRSQENSSHLFVLTTFRIFWLKVESVENEILLQNPKMVSIILSWQHFRDPEDTSLRLSSFSIQNVGPSLILFSRLNRLALKYKFPRSIQDTSFSISVSNPTFFGLPRVLKCQCGLDAHFDSTPGYSAVSFKEVDIAKNQESFEISSERPIFIAFIGQLVDGRVVQNFYRLNRAQTQFPGSLMEYPMLGRRKSLLRNTPKFVASSEFVIGEMENTSPASSFWNRSTQNRNNISAARAVQAGESWKYQYIFVTSPASASGIRGSNTQDQTTSFGAWFHTVPDRVVDILSATKNDSIAYLMSEIVPPPSILTGIEDMTYHFSALLRGLKGPEGHFFTAFQVITLGLPFSPNSTLSTASETLTFSPSDIYDTLIYHCVAPLPVEVPNRLRVSKEQMVRSMVAEIALSRIVTSSKAEGLNANYTANPPLPLEPNTSDEFLEQAVQKPHRSRPLYSYIWSKHPESPLLESRSGEIFDSLRQFKNIGVGHLNSTNAVRMGSYWVPGNDPQFYHWRDALNTDLDPPRSGNRAQIQLKDYRSSAKTLLSPGILVGDTDQIQTSHSAPNSVWGSQPQMNISDPSCRKSQISTDGIPMTQVEEGLHGSRHAFRFRRKVGIPGTKRKRMAGF
ncbi:hypothetical protein FQN57_001183 [Myotisia sp. PD_48]|nr:hypothetical protein FQN57_001183 [Myotisia sp. PD_48]